MRPWIIRSLIVFALVIVAPLPAWSIIVETNDGKIYRGHLLEQNVLRVTIRLDGTQQKKTFSRKEILRTTRLLDENRLRALKPDNPQAYWTYAKELAALKDDPEARDAALRLFLIAAFHNPEKFGYKSLVEMSGMGRNATEVRSFRAMAYLMDLLRDKDTLNKGSTLLDDPTARENFLNALVYLRRGKTVKAKELAQKTGVSDYFDVIPGLMTHAEFLQMCDKNPECKKCKQGRAFCVKCAGNPVRQRNCPVCNGKGWTICEECAGMPRRVKLSALQQEMIIRLQLLHAKNPKAKLGNSETKKRQSWSRLLAPGQLRPVPVMSLLRLTEFDPRQSVFTGGKWTTP